MLEFIQNNLYNISVIIIFIAIILILIKLRKKDTVKEIILALVVQAEKALGSGTGELKHAMVIDAFYDKLPSIITLLFTKKEIDRYITDGVNKLTKFLEVGDLLGFDEEEYIKLKNK